MAEFNKYLIKSQMIAPFTITMKSEAEIISQFSDLLYVISYSQNSFFGISAISS